MKKIVVLFIFCQIFSFFANAQGTQKDSEEKKGLYRLPGNEIDRIVGRIKGTTQQTQTRSQQPSRTTTGKQSTTRTTYPTHTTTRTTYPTQTTTRTPSPTIHIIYFSDIDDSKVGSSCQESNKYFTNEFIPLIERHTEFNVKKYFFSGRNSFTLQNLSSTVNRLNSSSNDVIFFYYTGHGFNSGYSNYPTLVIGPNSQSIESRQIDVIEIYKALQQKNHRLLIVIAEACNKIAPSRNDLYSVSLNGYFDPFESEEIHFKELFSNSRGDFLMSSSSVGEYSELVIGNPGFFTCSFRDTFSYFTSNEYTETATWENIFNQTKELTTKLCKENGKTQNPQWCAGNNCY